MPDRQDWHCSRTRRAVGEPSLPAGDDPEAGDAGRPLPQNSTLITRLQPLKGLTVVTLEHAIAAPFATRQLADLGARVIKIERPGSGDFARGYDSRVRGLASHFVWTNRSKESLTLGVKHPEAAASLLRLIVEKADIVVQNLAPGTRRSWRSRSSTPS